MTYNQSICTGVLLIVGLETREPRTGSLKSGDPVAIKASLAARISSEGDGTAKSMGVLFLNRISETPWFQGEEEYLVFEDFLGSPDALAKVVSSASGTVEYTGTAAIGDTIIVNVGFFNSITLSNPGSSGEDAEGWSGERPANTFADPVYLRTDSIRELIKKHGNSLTYDLVVPDTGCIA